MKKLLFILLSFMFLPVNAQITYTQTYQNVELRTNFSTDDAGNNRFVYGLEKYGRKILPAKYQVEYNGILKMFIFYNKREVRVFSTVTGNEVTRYFAPRKVTIVNADFKPYSSFAFGIKVKTKKCEKSLGIYTSIDGVVYEIPKDSRYIIH